MHLKEQIEMIGPGNSWGFSTCACFTPTPLPRSSNMVGLQRLGLPTWMWLTEGNSGAGGTCRLVDKCATVFVGPQGMAASFNRSSWRLKGLITGMETRAFVNSGSGSTGNGPLSLSAYGPNLNVLRDPRFGRASEDPSEDPFHAGHYASEFLQGSQKKDPSGKYPLMITMLKHFAAYSQEHNRGGDNYDISQHDLFETCAKAMIL
jgi:beta-glucosidase-like glycosyl hydrolase